MSNTDDTQPQPPKTDEAIIQKWIEEAIAGGWDVILLGLDGTVEYRRAADLQPAPPNEDETDDTQE